MMTNISYASAFFALIQKEFTQVYQHKADIVNPLIFFVVVITLFPLGLGPEPNLLARIAAGIIWVAALLSTMMGLERVFKADYDDGTIEQLLISSTPFFIYVCAKMVVHWLLTSLPLIILSPVAAYMLHIPTQGFEALMLTLLLGTPILSMIGIIATALTVSLPKSGVLLSLLVLPLYIPVLIFSTSAVDAASMGMAYNGHLAMLAGVMMLSIAVSPFATAAALKININ
ncbi:heme exporter protein CcmB [Flocculibacter collagenilyticus]|uniref:heme exporter protein CcmB n=1 Tax=Flocculibacter collagenilyticus TaxID=2744479 RepID=UPI0018F72561|nr:heme exporter protein CcmB [Flocculibacter collagenilyticus]